MGPAGFTALCETLKAENELTAAEVLCERLNQFFERIIDTVFAYGARSAVIIAFWGRARSRPPPALPRAAPHAAASHGTGTGGDVIKFSGDGSSTLCPRPAPPRSR